MRSSKHIWTKQREASAQAAAGSVEGGVQSVCDAENWEAGIAGAEMEGCELYGC